MIAAIQSIVSIFAMIFIGVLLAKKKIFNDESSSLFSKLVINLSLPLLIMKNIVEKFTKQSLIESGSGLLVSFIAIFLSYIIGMIIFKIINKEGKGNSIYTMMFTFSNTIFIGLPVCISVLGEGSIPYALLYDFANSMIFWTLAIYKINEELSATNQNNNGKNNILSKVLSPPLLSFIFSLILVVLNIRLPKFILDICGYIGNITTPLSMFIIGTMLANIDIKSYKFNLTILFILLGKFFIVPGITIAALSLFSTPALLKNTYVLQASMPIMTQTAIVAKNYNIAAKETSYIVGLSTLLSLLILPLYVYIISTL